jgi:hypothetical protein
MDVNFSRRHAACIASYVQNHCFKSPSLRNSNEQDHCELNSATVSETILFWSVFNFKLLNQATALLSMPRQLLGKLKIHKGKHNA